MANYVRGEIVAELDGQQWTLCLTLGALAWLENKLGATNLAGLAEKFSSGSLCSDDLVSVITAGLRGGGYTVTEVEVEQMRVEGGASGYIQVAVRLLEATFTPLGTE